MGCSNEAEQENRGMFINGVWRDVLLLKANSVMAANH